MSGIGDAIDRACGVTPAMRAEWAREAARPKIVLACQRCKAERAVTRDDVWPKAAAFCCFPCSDCITAVEQRAVMKEQRDGAPPLEFFDALGVRITFP